MRLLANLAVIGLLAQPLWAPSWGAGILGEVFAVGMPGALVVIAVFFGLIALYCLALQRTLTLLRAPNPRSVWLMFAIPFNFVEDFYIVRNVSTALADRMPSGFVRLWTVIGFGWCGFQILSLFPGPLGLIGGAVAIPMWIAHWLMTAHANRRLVEETRATATI